MNYLNTDARIDVNKSNRAQCIYSIKTLADQHIPRLVP